MMTYHEYLCFDAGIVTCFISMFDNTPLGLRAHWLPHHIAIPQFENF